MSGDKKQQSSDAIIGIIDEFHTDFWQKIKFSPWAPEHRVPLPSRRESYSVCLQSFNFKWLPMILHLCQNNKNEYKSLTKTPINPTKKLLLIFNDLSNRHKTPRWKELWIFLFAEVNT